MASVSESRSPRGPAAITGTVSDVTRILAHRTQILARATVSGINSGTRTEAWLASSKLGFKGPKAVSMASRLAACAPAA